jgi:hypothetical protein
MKYFEKQNNVVINVNNRRDQKLQELKTLFLKNFDALGPRWTSVLPLFMNSSDFARILWLNEVYIKNISVPGCILEFGSQFGASFNTLNMLKLIYEPWNVSRRIISLTTFEEGFIDVEDKDGEMVELGDYAVAENWKQVLESILSINTDSSLTSTVHEIVQGDVSLTLPVFLEHNPGIIISMAHFDMDVYKPTKSALELVISRMPKGSLLVFDELNHPAFPGETVAVNEVLGLKNLQLRKSTFQPYSCYAIIE